MSAYIPPFSSFQKDINPEKKKKKKLNPPLSCMATKWKIKLFKKRRSWKKKKTAPSSCPSFDNDTVRVGSPRCEPLSRHTTRSTATGLSSLHSSYHQPVRPSFFFCFSLFYIYFFTFSIFKKCRLIIHS